MNGIRYISGCSGIGGGDLGLSAAGFKCVCYIERENFPNQLLLERMYEGRLDIAPIFTDFTRFNGKPWRGKVDCFFAGIPCQPHSVAGKRGGKEDTRNLWPDMARITREMEPSVVVIENVEGLYSGDDAYGYEIAVDLYQLGYIVVVGYISAAEKGAPHERMRTFTFGFKRSNSHKKRHLDRKPQEHTTERRKQAQYGVDRSSNPSDYGQERIQRKRKEKIQKLERFSWCEDVRRVENLFICTDIPEPLVRGDSDGLSSRMDRYIWKQQISGLGNAIVPIVAEEAGNFIRNVLKKENEE